MRSSGAPPPRGEPPRPGRGRRWGLRALAVLAGLVVLAVAGVLAVASSLERPWLKRRLQASVRAASGLEIDYRAARLSLLSGATIEALAVRSPADVRPFAPDLVRVDRIEARWRLSSFAGRGPILDSLSLSGVTLTVVVDEQGRTTFDAIPTSGPSPPPGAPVPLSRLAATFLARAPAVAHLDVGDLSLVLLRTEGGAVSERIELGGVALATTARSAAPAAGWLLDASLGSPAAPLDLRIARSRRGIVAAARARLSLSAGASSSAVTAALDLVVPEQTFVPSASIAHWVHAEARFRFDPSAGRTEVTIDRTEAGDGAAHAQASIELPDRGEPIVRRAHVDVDLARILGWIPPGLVPVTAERAHLDCEIAALVAGPVVRLSGEGSVAVDLDLGNIAVDLAGGPLQIGGGKLSLRAEPAGGGGVAGRGTIQVGGVRLGAGREGVASDAVDVDFDGRQEGDGAITGQAAIRASRLEKGGGQPALLTGAQAGLRVTGLRPGADPLATRGDLALSVDLAGLDARVGGGRLFADGLALRAHTLLEGHAPYDLELQAPVRRLRFLRSDGVLLVDGPAAVDAKLRDARPDLARPERSRGAVQATLDLAGMRASADVTKGDLAIDYALRAAAPSLKALRPFLSPALGKRAPWDQIGVALRSGGHVDHLGGGAPTIAQTTELDLERPAFDGAAARAASLKVRSKGTARVHEAEVDLRLQGLAIAGGREGDEHVALSAAIDRERPALRVEVETEGRAGAELSASASFDRSRRAVRYDVDGHLAGLAPMGPFLANVRGLEGFDLSALDLAFSAHGDLLGVIDQVDRDGAILLAPAPSLTAGVEGAGELRVSHLHWSHGDTAIIAPAVAWRGELHVAGDLRTLESHLAVDALHLDLGPHDVDFTRIRDESSLSLRGDLADPQTGIHQRMSIATVGQDFVPGYPLGDLTLAVAAERDRDGLVRVADLQVGNGLGGTTLGLKGNIELAGRRTLSVTTTLGQDLARLTRTPERFAGRGRLAMEASVTSPDFALFRVRSALKATDVSFEMPRAHVGVEGANGEIPITVALEVGKNGVSLRADEKRSPYSMLRFVDQHPLLSRSGFLSVASVKTPFVTVAPLVGNLEIEQNVISLRQFELGVRGGSITGQCGLDWDGPKSTVELHVRASGVQSSHGEPFDGNIAVVIAAGDRTIEGRAEILRIGERHLLDLLDMQDPMHVDRAMNRIRAALTVGYPDRLRVVFDHGFASARLELGGLARLVSIGELRGIPMGPIIDQLLAPTLDPDDTKGAP